MKIKKYKNINNISLMLYLVCPTCNEHLGNRQLLFDEGIDKITNSNDTKEKKEQLKIELINSLGLDNYCCRARIMTYTRLIEIVK